MGCIEEIINISILIQRFEEAMHQGYLYKILNEIIKQSRVEFNYEEESQTLEFLDEIEGDTE